MTKTQIIKIIISVLIAALTALGAGLGLQSCTATRVVNTRMHDLNKIAADQAAFKAQKDLPGGKKTLKAYLWALEKAAYDEQQG